IGTPQSVCNTFARFDFIRVPLPAARTTAKIGGRVPPSFIASYGLLRIADGLGRQDSNLRSRDQNPVPCHLATPQYLVLRPRRRDYTGADLSRQYCSLDSNRSPF